MQIILKTQEDGNFIFDNSFMFEFCMKTLLLNEACDQTQAGFHWFTCLEHLLNAVFSYNTKVFDELLKFTNNILDVLFERVSKGNDEFRLS